MQAVEAGKSSMNTAMTVRRLEGTNEQAASGEIDKIPMHISPEAAYLILSRFYLIDAGGFVYYFSIEKNPAQSVFEMCRMV